MNELTKWFIVAGVILIVPVNLYFIGMDFDNYHERYIEENRDFAKAKLNFIMVANLTKTTFTDDYVPSKESYVPLSDNCKGAIFEIINPLEKTNRTFELWTDCDPEASTSEAESDMIWEEWKIVAKKYMSSNESKVVNYE